MTRIDNTCLAVVEVANTDAKKNKRTRTKHLRHSPAMKE